MFYSIARLCRYQTYHSVDRFARWNYRCSQRWQGWPPVVPGLLATQQQLIPSLVKNMFGSKRIPRIQHVWVLVSFWRQLHILHSFCHGPCGFQTYLQLQVRHVFLQISRLIRGTSYLRSAHDRRVFWVSTLQLQSFQHLGQVGRWKPRVLSGQCFGSVSKSIQAWGKLHHAISRVSALVLPGMMCCFPNRQSCHWESLCHLMVSTSDFPFPSST